MNIKINLEFNIESEVAKQIIVIVAAIATQTIFK